MNAYDETLLILHESCDEGIITEDEKRKLIDKVKDAKDKSVNFAKNHKTGLLAAGAAATALIGAANEANYRLKNKAYDDYSKTKYGEAARKLCQDYNSGKISKEEFHRKFDELSKIYKVDEGQIVNYINKPLGGFRYGINKIKNNKNN